MNDFKLVIIRFTRIDSTIAVHMDKFSGAVAATFTVTYLSNLTIVLPFSI